MNAVKEQLARIQQTVSAPLGQWLAKNFPSVYERAPAFLRLMRDDRPIGTYLLLWPTLSAAWLAADGSTDWDLLYTFSLGTWLLRSARRRIMHQADHNVNGKGQRTEGRMSLTGRVNRREAATCFVVPRL